MSGLDHYVMSALTYRYVLLLNRTTWIPHKYHAYNSLIRGFVTLNLVRFANSAVGCQHNILGQREREGGPHLEHISPLWSKECKLPGLTPTNGTITSTGDQAVPSPLPSLRQILLREAGRFQAGLLMR